MVTPPPWMKSLVTPVLCLVLLAGCQSQSSGTAVKDAGGQRAFNASLPFSVTWESEQLVIRGSGTPIEVEADLGDIPVGGPDVTPVDPETFVATTDTHLTLVKKNGSAKTIPLLATTVTSTGDRILVGSDGDQLGDDDLDIRVFDKSLKEQDHFTIHKLQEREAVTPANLLPEGIRLISAGKNAFWVGYRDAQGYYRGGSWMLAKHDFSGRRLGTVRLDGLVYQHATSPDGRYLALFAGGSGGACFTYASLRVVDLEQMTLLNTAPDVPPAAQTTAGSAPPYFSGRSLRWVDESTLLADGIVGGSMGDCDQGLGAWRRTFTVGQTPAVVDEPLDEAIRDERGWIGPNCGDVIAPQDGALVITQNDQSTVVPDARLIYRATIPENCR